MFCLAHVNVILEIFSEGRKNLSGVL